MGSPDSSTEAAAAVKATTAGADLLESSAWMTIGAVALYSTRALYVKLRKFIGNVAEAKPGKLEKGEKDPAIGNFEEVAAANPASFKAKMREQDGLALGNSLSLTE